MPTVNIAYSVNIPLIKPTINIAIPGKLWRRASLCRAREVNIGAAFGGNSDLRSLHQSRRRGTGWVYKQNGDNKFKRDEQGARNNLPGHSIIYSGIRGGRLNLTRILILYLSRKRFIRFWRLPVTVKVAGSLFLRSLVKACRVRHEYVALPSSGLAALIWRSPCEVTTNLPPVNKIRAHVTQIDLHVSSIPFF